MRLGRAFGGAALVAALCTGGAQATPTTNIWNPSTDIQAKGVAHLGIDDYFSFNKAVKHASLSSPDIGVTYGLGHGFEVGADVWTASKFPVAFNVKWGLEEQKIRPAFAVGLMNIGLNNGKTASPGTLGMNGLMGYALAAKTFEPYGRVTLGGYGGKKHYLGRRNAGAIAAWDRSFGKKWWFSVDYAQGANANGALGVGGSYKMASNVSLIVAYMKYNSKDFYGNTDGLTTQLDIDF